MSNSTTDYNDQMDKIHTYTEKLWKENKGKFQSKKQFDTLVQVRKRFLEMSLYRKVSCWWDSGTSETNYDVESQMVLNGVGSGKTGSDWQSRWNQDYKQYSMWREVIEGRSNVKSPMTFAPVEALLADFQENATGVLLTAQADEDEAKVKLYSSTIAHIENIGNIAAAKATTMKECVITGTAIAYNGFITRSREVDLVLNDPEIEDYIKEVDDGDDEELQQSVNTSLDNNKPITKKTKIEEYNNCAYIHIPLSEFFIDPGARCIRGFSHEAVDCIWRTRPTLDQVRAEFLDSEDPFVIQSNVKKVKPAYTAFNSYDGSILSFFKMPGDIPMFADKVELIKYYNKQTDKYIVIANDVIIRDGPLPYNHKELPFSRHIFLEMPGQFYGMGYGAILESQQSENETLKNMAIETMRINISRPIFINTDVFEDIDSQWDRLESGQKIEVGGSVGPDNIRPLDPIVLPGDFFEMLNDTKQDAIAASGVNPLAYSMPQPKQTVRTNLLSQESTVKMFKKGITNWGEGYRETVRQFIAIIRQQYPNIYTTETNDNIGDESNPQYARPDLKPGEEFKKYPEIRVKGYSINEGEDGTLTTENKQGYSQIELKPKYLDLSKDPLIEVNLDELLPITLSIKMQRIEQMFNLLIPVLSNKQIIDAPGVSELVKELVEIHGANPKITESLNDSSSGDDREEAEEENRLMLQGQQVPGMPGRSPVHILEHAQQLIQLISLTKTPPPGMLAQDMQTAGTVISTFAQHLMLDMTPRQEIGEAALSQASQMANKINPQPKMGIPQPPQPGMPPQAPPPGMGGAPGMVPQGGMQGQNVPQQGQLGAQIQMQ